MSTALAIIAAHQKVNPLLQVSIAALAGTAQKTFGRMMTPKVRFITQAVLTGSGFLFDYYIIPGYFVGPVLFNSMLSSVQRVQKLYMLRKDMWK